MKLNLFRNAWILALPAVLSLSALAQEAGLDPVSAIRSANLICGRVDGKFIVFSAERAQVWYAFATPAEEEIFRSAGRSAEIEGVKAYTYSLRDPPVSMPTPAKPNAGMAVTYKLSYGYNASFLSLRPDSKGSLRLFKGEDGRNGKCRFLE